MKEQPKEFIVPLEVLQNIINLLSFMQQQAIDSLSNSKALMLQIQALLPVALINEGAEREGAKKTNGKKGKK